MVSARCGAPTCDGLTSCRRWKSLLVAVILFVGFVVGERPAFCFSLDRFQLWVMSRDSKHTCDVLFFAQTQ